MLDEEKPKSVHYGTDQATPTKERRPYLQVNIIPVTAETLTKHFPQYDTGGDYEGQAKKERQRLSTGLTYWAIAQDPETGKDVGAIFINLEQPNNLFSIGVNEPYQRKGITKQLIRHAQDKFDHLTLQNASGLGNKIYEQMGFVVSKDRSDLMVWPDPSHILN